MPRGNSPAWRRPKRPAWSLTEPRQDLWQLLSSGNRRRRHPVWCARRFVNNGEAHGVRQQGCRLSRVRVLPPLKNEKAAGALPQSRAVAGATAFQRGRSEK